VGDTIAVSVRDNGVGFADALPEKKGMGLQTMRYRSALIGASLSILKIPSGGTRVDCSVKQLDAAAEDKDNGKDADQAAAKTQGVPRR
jgi:nitrate/nitrite-specific signal transduction histidine kinase